MVECGERTQGQKRENLKNLMFQKYRHFCTYDRGMQ